MSGQMAILCFAPDDVREDLSKTYTLHYLVDLDERAAFFHSSHPGIEVVLTNGTRGITTHEIEQLPDLKIVNAFGAGYENVDVATLRSKGIAATHGAGTNTKSVADHAMALLLASGRRLIPMHEVVQKGGWATANYQWPSIYGKRLGILGLGRIGMEIAKRAQAFDLEIGYHNRSKRDDVSFSYHTSLLSLAAWSDYLILASPGGPSTQHLVNAEALAALGADGIVVNIGRGSIIDTDALVHALKTEIIAGAGLDVVDGEPIIPKEMIGLKSLIISPHIAGRTDEAVDAKYDQFLENIDLCLSGKPVATPIPDD